MLKRKAYQKLVEWKNTHRNNCLMVKGARQVAKTYLIREFGKKEYKSFIEINTWLCFYKNGYSAVDRDWQKIQNKCGKTVRKKREKNIAYSRAITYIPKTGDFRLQTVMPPIGCFWKLLRRQILKTLESNFW